MSATEIEDARVAPERCPAISGVGAVQPEMDRGNATLSFRATSEIALLRVLLRRHLRRTDDKAALRLLDELEQLP